MKILVWKSKYSDVMVCARDLEEEGRAWLYLFKLMEENDFYHDLDEDEAVAYRAAKKGNPVGAKLLIELRNGGEYEEVEIEEVIEP